jgi:hypothetical protein
MFFPPHMTTPLWPPPPEKPAKPPGDPRKPVACVRKSTGMYVDAAWCGLSIELGAYLFPDPKYARRHYADVRGPGLRACPDCIKAIDIAIVKGDLR